MFLSNKFERNFRTHSNSNFIHLIFPTLDCVIPGAGALEIAINDALDSYKNTVASRARLGVKVTWLVYVM